MAAIDSASERRVCQVLGVSRSCVRYVSRQRCRSRYYGVTGLALECYGEGRCNNAIA
jgi:hypothetical protein